MKVLNRIKANEDFVSTVRHSRALKSPSYIVHYKNNELNICRIGISVSKKIGIAVTRNRIKRQIRAMCDSLVQYSLHACDVVVVVKADYLSKSYQENLDILRNLFKEIGITE